MITEKKNIFGYEVADLLIKVSSKRKGQTPVRKNEDS